MGACVLWSSPAVFAWCVIGWFQDDLCGQTCLPAVDRLSPGITGGSSHYPALRYWLSSVSGFHIDGYALTRCQLETSQTHTHSCLGCLQAQPHTHFESPDVLKVPPHPSVWRRFSCMALYSRAQSLRCAQPSGEDRKLLPSAASDVISGFDHSASWTAAFPPPLLAWSFTQRCSWEYKLVSQWRWGGGGGGVGGDDARKAWPCLKTLSQLAVREDKEEESGKAADSGFMPLLPPPTAAAGLRADLH